MQAVAQRAHVFTSSGYILAERGAFFAARQEFMRALRIITRSLDASLGTTSHDGALAAGVKALDEADDFRRAMVSRDVDMEVIVSAHRTPILKGRSLEDVSPMQAVQSYYSYAQEQLGVAGGREPIASIALHGLAKLQPHLAADQEIFWDENSGKAMVYDKAALLVDRGNFMAANDLGVQLAQHGYLSEASTLLDQAALQHPNPTTWRNLASVYQRVGRPDLSRLANMRAQEQAQLEKTEGHPANGVHWVSPEQFANTVRHSSPGLQSRTEAGTTEKGATEKRVTRKKVASDATGKISRSRTAFWPFVKRSASMKQ